jgi:hypothetical protein
MLQGMEGCVLGVWIAHGEGLHSVTVVLAFVEKFVGGSIPSQLIDEGISPPQICDPDVIDAER